MRIKSTIPQFVSQNCQIVQLITQFEFHDLYTPSPRWRSRTAWTSRPSAVCSTTTRRASRWIHTPTLPRTRSSKRRKRWAISYPVLSDGFRYPLSLGSASAHPIEMWRSNKLGIKEKISRGNFPRLFSCPVPSGLPHRSHCVPMNMNRLVSAAFLLAWRMCSGVCFLRAFFHTGGQLRFVGTKFPVHLSGNEEIADEVGGGRQDPGERIRW